MVPKGNKQLLDTMWLHGVLGSIGEQFDDGEEICGIVVNVRPKQVRAAGSWACFHAQSSCIHAPSGAAWGPAHGLSRRGVAGRNRHFGASRC